MPGLQAEMAGDQLLSIRFQQLLWPGFDTGIMTQQIVDGGFTGIDELNFGPGRVGLAFGCRCGKSDIFPSSDSGSDRVADRQ